MSPAARIPRRRRITAALAVAALTVAASGCTVANSGHGGYDADTLRIVISQEPPTLEPCESSLTSTGIVVRSNITEPLIERDSNTGELTPLLSTGWRQTSPTEWTFDIREGVTFSDGSPFTAQDAAFAIDRAVNSDLQCNVDGYVFGDDELKLATPDDKTLTVTTVKPDPILPLRISFVEIVPRSTSTTEKVREPIGTGPYAIEDWEYGQKLVLARNAHYWGKAPAFARAEYQWRSEGSVRPDWARRTARATGAFRSRTTRPPPCASRPPKPRSTTCACARPSTTRSTGPASSRRCSAGSASPPHS
jgi:peptide/nickel transport system substrate-binding protein